MPSSDPRRRYGDIVANIARIRGHIGTVTSQEFESDPLRIDAVERCLARISEAAVKLGDERTRLDAPDLPWRQIRDLGNVLRHAYDGVDPRRLWLLVVNDLPGLDIACRQILAATPQAPSSVSD